LSHKFRIQLQFEREYAKLRDVSHVGALDLDSCLAFEWWRNPLFGGGPQFIDDGDLSGGGNGPTGPRHVIAVI
jgi:hypothetical protein